jgi:hypothetical protein
MHAHNRKSERGKFLFNNIIHVYHTSSFFFYLALFWHQHSNWVIKDTCTYTYNRISGRYYTITMEDCFTRSVYMYVCMASKASIQLDVISYFVVSDERKKKSYYAENKKTRSWLELWCRLLLWYWLINIQIDSVQSRQINNSSYSFL